jgi:glycosyltransferase involved in cell wall biosynthesis
MGVPIVASDIPENKQVFGEEEVLYFKTNDVNDLAQKLEFAIGHPEVMGRFGINCRERVNADYLWGNIALLYASVYDDLLA